MEFLLVDGHVHLHDCFPTAAFLEHAASNLAIAAERIGADANWAGCLLLAERSGEAYVPRLLEAGPGTRHWQIRMHREQGTVEASRSDGVRLFLIVGKQAATRVGLEVLALGTTSEIPDGMPLEETIAAAAAADALPVLPWGVGKWWFDRGRYVLETLERMQATGLMLGDNAARPRWTPPPIAFLRARARGVPILPGTDPLPLAAQVRQAGRYGFILRVEGPLDRPAEAVKRGVRAMTTQPGTFGRRGGVLDVWRSQVDLRRSRRGGTSATP